jgi:hypothetical protein
MIAECSNFWLKTSTRRARTRRGLTVKDKTETVASDWKALLKKTPNADAVQRLIDVLGVRKLTVRVIGRGSEGVQGVANRGPTDYFRRMLAEQLAPGELRDQEVLRDIERWNHDRGGRMFEHLFDATDRTERYVAVWAYFAARIETEDLYGLAERLFQETLHADGAGANMQDRPALLAVWRRLNHRRLRRESVEWLNGQIALALPISLRFADDLLYYWAGESGVVLDDGWTAVRRAMLDQARRVYTTADDLLRAVVDTDSERQAYALLHFVRPPQHREQVDIEPQDRDWLAPVLIEAAQRKSRFVVRNLMSMVGDHYVWAGLPENDPETLLERIYHLRPEHVEVIFGDYKEQLLQLLADHEPHDDMEKSASIQAARLLKEIRATKERETDNR